MKINIEPIFALGCGAIVASGLLCQPAQAGLNESGTSILADVNGPVTPDNPATDQLTVDWSVVENASDIYTYTYTVYNPVGDIQLAGSPDPGAPEEFQTFTVDFLDSFAPGMVLDNSITGGVFGLNNGQGIQWLINSPTNSGYPVYGGDNSGPLSFQSDFGPELANASATDNDPPSPWSSSPYGQQVPAPAPDTTSTLILLGGIMLIFPIGSRVWKKAV